MTDMIELTPEYLRQRLRYEPDTGKLFWREGRIEFFKNENGLRIFNGRFAGKEVTTHSGNGYLQVNINRKLERAHRVAWAIYHGEWPAGVIDHIDGDGLNNRLNNLRDVDRTENLRNAKRAKDNTSSVTGVSRSHNKWRARIGGREVGVFESFDAAVAARRQAEVEHGYHKNHGRKS